MTINEIQDEIIDEFSGFDDWMDKYQLLIDLGNEQEPLDDHFSAESDALIVKGIVALLIRVLSDHTPQEILDADLYFIEQIGLKEHLSPTRSNGLLAMVKQIKMYALAFNETLKN